MLIKENLKKVVALAALVSVTLVISACGGGSSSTNTNSQNDCLSLDSDSGGVNVTNNCDFKVNVAFFDPLFRFELKSGETTFLARTGNIRYGACKGVFKPREDDGGFVCS